MISMSTSTPNGLDMMRLDDIIGDFADQFNYSFW